MRVPACRFASRLAILALLVALEPAAPLFAQKKAGSAGDFYLSYVAAVEKMKSMKDLKPYLPKRMATMVDKMPPDMEKEMMEDQRKEAVTQVRIVNERPYRDGYIVEAAGTRKTDGKKIRGWAKIIRQDGALKLAGDDWSGTAPPAPPKIPASVAQSGRAVGEMTVNGQTAKLLYAYARAMPDSHDKTKTDYDVVLSDVPWNPKDYNQNDHVKAGTLHYIELTIGPDSRTQIAWLYHRAFKQGFLSSSGSPHVFEAEKMAASMIAGRAYVEGEQEAMGDKFYYAATFRAPVAAQK